jgi:hypothetical protein
MPAAERLRGVDGSPRHVLVWRLQDDLPSSVSVTAEADFFLRTVGAGPCNNRDNTN